MKTLIKILALFLAVAAGAQTHVRVYLPAFNADPATNRYVAVQPLQPFRGNVTRYYSGTNDYVYVSNALRADYLTTIERRGSSAEIAFQFTVTATNLGIIDAHTNTSVKGQMSYPVSGQSSWTIDASDARYAQIGSGGGSGETNFLASVGEATSLVADKAANTNQVKSLAVSGGLLSISSTVSNVTVALPELNVLNLLDEFSVLRTGTSNGATLNGAITINSTLNVNDFLTGTVGVFSGNITSTGGSFIGDGSLLTALNAGQLGSGTIPPGRFPAILPAVSGTLLTSLNANVLDSGTIPDARIGSWIARVTNVVERTGGVATNLSLYGTSTAQTVIVTNLYGNGGGLTNINGTELWRNHLGRVRESETPLVILDQDFTIDIGDTHGLKQAMAMADQGLIKIIAVGSTLTNEYSAAGVSAYLHYYGHGNVPVGVNKSMRYAVPAGGGNGPIFLLEPVALNVPTRGYSLYSSNYPAAYKLYRQVLASAPDGKVIINVEGDSRNIEQLWDSAADEISPLTGAELCGRKVKFFFANCGSTNSGVGEFNLNQDTTAATVWNRITNPVVWMTWENATGSYVGQNTMNLEYHPPTSPIYFESTNHFYRTLGDHPTTRPWDGLAKLYIGAQRSINDGTNWLDGQSMFTVSPAMRMNYISGGWVAISNSAWSGLPLNQYYLVTNGVHSLTTNLVNGFIDAAPYRGAYTQQPGPKKWRTREVNLGAVHRGNFTSASASSSTGISYYEYADGGPVSGLMGFIRTDVGSRNFFLGTTLPTTVTQAVSTITMHAGATNLYSLDVYSAPYFAASAVTLGGVTSQTISAPTGFYTIRFTNSWSGASLDAPKIVRALFQTNSVTLGGTGYRTVMHWEIAERHSNEE
jgi:hypothetical protein